MDERKLRLYRFLLDMGRVTLVDIPEPYYSELNPETTSEEPDPVVEPETTPDPVPEEIPTEEPVV